MDLISLTEFTTVIVMFVISMFWKAPYSITNAPITVFATPPCHFKCTAPFQSATRWQISCRWSFLCAEQVSGLPGSRDFNLIWQAE